METKQKTSNTNILDANQKSIGKNLLGLLKNNTMVLILAGVMILFEILLYALHRSHFFVPANISNLIRQNAYVAILAAGMLLCILTGGNIDLSVGSVVALVGALAGVFIKNLGINIYLAILICLLVGILIGAIHGGFIAYLHVPPFITTLAGMLLWRGVATIILDGKPISPFPENYKRLFEFYLPGSKGTSGKLMNIPLWGETYSCDSGIFFTTLIIFTVICAILLISQFISRRIKISKGYTVSSLISFWSKNIFLCILILVFGFFLAMDKGVPVILIWLAVIIAAYAYFTQNTVPGRYLYAIGGNEKAARLSGINTKNVMFFAYTNMGFIAAIAALVCVARFDSAQPTAGTNYEMDAIASCFIGGASAYGGTGTIAGAVIGAIFMGVLNNGMSMLSIDMNWQRAVKGLVLLLAVIFDVYSKKKKTSK